MQFLWWTILMIEEFGIGSTNNPLIDNFSSFSSLVCLMLYWHLLWDWPRRFSPFSQALIQSNSKLEIIRTWWLAFSNTKFYFVSLWVPIGSLWYFPLFWLVIIITQTKRALIWGKKKKHLDCTCTYQLLSSWCTLIDYFFRDDTFYHFLIWEKKYSDCICTY